MKKVTLNSINRANSANRNNTVNNGASTMVEKNNTQEVKTMTSINFEALSKTPTKEIIKMIEEKMDINLSDGISTFVNLIFEQAYAEKWLSIMDNPFILHVTMNETLSFEEALKKWATKFNSIEYRSMGKWICHDIREAIEPFCDETKDGNIAPFIGYCWSCWCEGERADIYTYEKIREFFEG